jgi:RNA polymerase sigma factor (sigma-70 family)
MTAEAGLIGSKRTVTGLVTRAGSGDKQAWDALVERYAPLIWSICRRYRLAGADVGQNVWLHLLDQLGNLRDPATLAGWLAATTQRECLRVLRAQTPSAATSVTGTGNIADQHTEIAEQELVRAERHTALREAFTRLPPGCQQLLALLIHDPPLPHAQISATLGIPAGGIGPLGSRCLHQLRGDPVITALISSEAAPGRDGLDGKQSAGDDRQQTARPQMTRTGRSACRCIRTRARTSAARIRSALSTWRHRCRDAHPS